MAKYKLFHLTLNNISKEGLLSELLTAAEMRSPSYLCAVNAHMTVESKRDVFLKKAVNKATWAITDGMPVVWAFNQLNNTDQSRIAGMDLTPSLLDAADKIGLTVSVYGNTKKNLDLFREYIIENHKNIKIGVLISPPFRILNEQENIKYIHQINASRTNILFVSLGCPKQEKWMLNHSDKINAMALGIGNAINTTIGVEKRPPVWVQRIGMEWFFRLIQNPRRLLKRYLVTNTCFIILFIKHWIKSNAPKL